ncbi:hypothetical protein [Okeania sp. SIO2C2]|uniref:hypothetical protein n=1 Tax=Okeania sp. SIO2C2 TaxID=2607787 RepID=UPI00257F8BD4|nr:hypothetical protein [Okeania sp. SIO2C2]
MKVFKVLQVSVIKITESPLKLCIQAEGLSATSGWTNPRLDNSADPNPDDSVLEFSFDADKPSDVSLPRLTPIMATVDFTPTNGADAVIVSARINSITVHAGEFITPGQISSQPTTLAYGEEEPQFTTQAVGEEGPQPTTLAYGEEGPQPTTLAYGEEGPQLISQAQPTTLAYGEEEGPQPTTQALGEEGPQPTTQALGEEGPQPTTQALGEEGPQPTTQALGEEEPQATTLAYGEEGPTTYAIGEESGPFGRY